MKISITFFLIVLGFCSCGESQQKKLVEVGDPTAAYLFTDTDSIYFKNCQFTERGVVLGKGSSSSFVRIVPPSRLSPPLHFSMWINFSDEDPRFPQMIFSGLNEAGNKRLNLWVAGERITGDYFGQPLWAENYKYLNGRSAQYYDLFRLEPGKYYFLSTNIQKDQLDIYINAELYATHKRLNTNNGTIDKIFLGIEQKLNGNFDHQFKGYIKNFTIFERLLTENEMYSLGARTFKSIEQFNMQHELSKFNFEQNE